LIAIVTSTLFPSDKSIFEGKRTSFDSEERSEQTRQTIISLRDTGLDEIYLADNSEKQFHQSVHSMFDDVNVLTFDNYPFNNRGTSEALLILNSLKYLPEDVPLLKISGRYCLNNHFNRPTTMRADFIGKGFNYERKNGIVSTRCYMVRNKELLEQLMLKTLVVMYAYPLQIVGPRSFMKFLKQKLRRTEIPSETSVSIEMGVARSLKNSNLNVSLLDRIGLEGYVAGSGSKLEFLSE
jgi:hypothetical protein